MKKEADANKKKSNRKPASLTEGAVFAQRLSAIMEERGISQAQMARLFEEHGEKIQRQTISYYMLGQSKPNVDCLTTICRILNVSSDYLLGFSEVKAQDQDFRTACDYSNLSENAVWLTRNIGAVSNAINFLAAKFDGKNILDVPLFKFASAFMRVVKTSLDAYGSVSGEKGGRLETVLSSYSKEEIESVMYSSSKVELEAALYSFSKVCSDIPDDVLLSDDTLNELEKLSKDLEMKRVLALMNSQNAKEVPHGEH